MGTTKNSKKKTVVVIDAGGRGAVLIHKYSQSRKVGKLICIPGNDLVKLNCKKPLKIFPHLTTTSINEIIEICKKEKVHLVDVNQDNAVEAGLVDALLKEGINAVGPTRAAGQIEWDKAWSRDFMKKYHLPIPAYKVCHSEKEGVDFLKKQKESSWFVKATGLTYGKGVYPADDNKEAIEKIAELSQFGKSGQNFLLEEALVGEEFSAYAVSDGKTFKLVGNAQDNKRLFNFDEGPNTGGVGASSPPMLVSKKIISQIEKIFKKSFDGLQKEGRPYKGILYLGGMLVDGKAYIIEFNARWGSPEAEVIVPSFTSDFYELGEAVFLGKLKNLKIKQDKKYRILVTGSSKGYPGNYSTVNGKEIRGIREAAKTGVTIYGAGVKMKNNKYYAAGGRLFHLVAEGKDVIEAREKAYRAMSLISVEGNNLHYRTDIGWRDVQRLRFGKNS